jgi:ribosomal protein S18 acetylase RimI-like enzyme
MNAEPVYELRRYGDGEDCPARDLAELHKSLLSHSPIPMLGPEFAEQFYYTHLPREGHIFGAVAYVDGHAAGFVVATASCGDFLIKAVKQKFFRVSYLLAKSTLAKPARLKAIAEAIYRMYKRAGIPHDAGEILSIGVLPSYGAKFTRQTKIRISQDLVEVAVGECRRRGAKSIRVTVETSNLPAQLMYAGMGWNLEDRNVLDETGRIVEFTLDLA